MTSEPPDSCGGARGAGSSPANQRSSRNNTDPGQGEPETQGDRVLTLPEIHLWNITLKECSGFSCPFQKFLRNPNRCRLHSRNRIETKEQLEATAVSTQTEIWIPENRNRNQHRNRILRNQRTKFLPLTLLSPVSLQNNSHLFS